jgi:hypothetical protein
VVGTVVLVVPERVVVVLRVVLVVARVVVVVPVPVVVVLGGMACWMKGSLLSKVDSSSKGRTARMVVVVVAVDGRVVTPVVLDVAAAPPSPQPAIARATEVAASMRTTASLR